MDYFTNSRAGIYFDLFSPHIFMGSYATVFDGKIAAIYKDLLYLQTRLKHFLKVVYRLDSRAALQAIDSQNVFISLIVK